MKWLADGDNDTHTTGRQTGDHLAAPPFGETTIFDKKMGQQENYVFDGIHRRIRPNTWASKMPGGSKARLTSSMSMRSA